MTQLVSTTLADDTLEGVAAISAFIGKPPRRVYYLISQRKLPTFMIGNRHNMRKSTYERHIQRLEAETLMAEADA